MYEAPPLPEDGNLSFRLPTQDLQDASLYSLFGACRVTFMELYIALATEKHHVSASNSLARISDEYGRLGVWGGNSGADRTGRGSLDDRLRNEANLRGMVAQMLESLYKCLFKALEVAKSYIHPLVFSDEDTDDLSSNSDSDSESEDISTASEPLRGAQISIKSLFNVIFAQVQALYESSAILRRPAIPDKYIRSVTRNQTITSNIYGMWDKAHVAEKITQWLKDNSRKLEEPLKLDYYLCARLGGGNTRRREQLKYWQDHPEQGSTKKMNHEPLPAMYSAAGNSQSHLPQQKVSGELSNTAKSVTHSVAPSKQTVQSFSTVAQSVLNDAATISGRPKTTYAPSDHRPSAKELHLPDFPRAEPGADTVACPYCFTQLNVKEMTTQRQLWKKHVYRDLRPYMCTFEDCKQSEKLYVTRHDWIFHETQMHRRRWVCRECEESFSSRLMTENHMREHHAGSFTEAQLPILLDLCERAVDSNDPTDCPLCEKTLPLSRLRGQEDLQGHLAWHLEQIALFVISGEDTEEDDSNEDNSNKAMPAIRALDAAELKSLSGSSQKSTEKAYDQQEQSIKHAIQKIVSDSFMSSEYYQITDEIIRYKVEKQLKLDDCFLETEAWKERSSKMIDYYVKTHFRRSRPEISLKPDQERRWFMIKVIEGIILAPIEDDESVQSYVELVVPLNERKQMVKTTLAKKKNPRWNEMLGITVAEPYRVAVSIYQAYKVRSKSGVENRTSKSTAILELDLTNYKYGEPRDMWLAFEPQVTLNLQITMDPTDAGSKPPDLDPHQEFITFIDNTISDAFAQDQYDTSDPKRSSIEDWSELLTQVQASESYGTEDPVGQRTALSSIPDLPSPRETPPRRRGSVESEPSTIYPVAAPDDLSGSPLLSHFSSYDLEPGWIVEPSNDGFKAFARYQNRRSARPNPIADQAYAAGVAATTQGLNSENEGNFSESSVPNEGDHISSVRSLTEDEKLELQRRYNQGKSVNPILADAFAAGAFATTNPDAVRIYAADAAAGRDIFNSEINPKMPVTSLTEDEKLEVQRRYIQGETMGHSLADTSATMSTKAADSEPDVPQQGQMAAEMVMKAGVDDEQESHSLQLERQRQPYYPKESLGESSYYIETAGPTRRGRSMIYEDREKVNNTARRQVRPDTRYIDNSRPLRYRSRSREVERISLQEEETYDQRGTHSRRERIVIERGRPIIIRHRSSSPEEKLRRRRSDLQQRAPSPLDDYYNYKQPEVVVVRRPMSPEGSFGRRKGDAQTRQPSAVEDDLERSRPLRQEGAGSNAPRGHSTDTWDRPKLHIGQTRKRSWEREGGPIIAKPRVDPAYYMESPRSRVVERERRRPSTPPSNYAPSINTETITHHRHIDHEYEVVSPQPLRTVGSASNAPRDRSPDARDRSILIINNPRRPNREPYYDYDSDIDERHVPRSYHPESASYYGVPQSLRKEGVTSTDRPRRPSIVDQTRPRSYNQSSNRGRRETITVIDVPNSPSALEQGRRRDESPEIGDPRRDDMIREETERLTREKFRQEVEERHNKERLKDDLRKSGFDDSQITQILTKEQINSDGVEDDRPTITRMARRYLSIETLNQFRIDYQLDTDPDYVLIRKWVPKDEQDALWDHTRRIRERRRLDALAKEGKPEPKHERHDRRGDEIGIVGTDKRKVLSPHLAPSFAGGKR